MSSPAIALLTDFGFDNSFVAAMKGTILSINPAAEIVDISHNVSSYDIRAAGFLLASCYRFFPSGTIFVAVVDPGVGSSRKILLIETPKYFFIAPDNGLLTLALEGRKVRAIRQLTNSKYFLTSSRTTFEGRDKMAPGAAWLSLGVPSAEFGGLAGGYRKLQILKPRLAKREVRGEIIFQDKFGNLITNIPAEMLDRLRKKSSFTRIALLVGTRMISTFADCYSRGKRGEIFVLAGSSGLLEIARRQAPASKMLKVKPGDEVRIVVQ